VLGRNLRCAHQEEHADALQGAPLTPDPSFPILVLIVIAAFTVEAATGFGAMIIALALGAFFLPLTALLAPLVLLDVLLCGYLALRHRGAIDLAWLLRRVLPLMTIGVLLGFFVAFRTPEAALRRLLGVLVLSVAARDLIALARTAALRAPLPPPLRLLGLLGAGIMHGLFAAGGPLLVYVLSRSELAKSAFRSTLAVVWVVLDLVLLTGYGATGRITAATLTLTTALVPCLFVAVALGEWAHARLDERRFRQAVMAVLLVVGITLVV
jgi:uncharacterized membrane protein YfcA